MNAYAQHKSQYLSASPDGVQQISAFMTNLAHMIAYNAKTDLPLVEGFLAFN